MAGFLVSRVPEIGIEPATLALRERDSCIDITCRHSPYSKRDTSQLAPRHFIKSPE